MVSIILELSGGSDVSRMLMLWQVYCCTIAGLYCHTLAGSVPILRIALCGQRCEHGSNDADLVFDGAVLVFKSADCELAFARTFVRMCPTFQINAL